MASIKKRGKAWRARYRDEAGREHARHFDRRVDAQQWLDSVKASVLTGQYVDPRAGKVTVREFGEQWRAAQVWRGRTATRVETDLRLHAYPVLGDRPIASVRSSDVQAVVKRLAGSHAPSTTKVIYSTLRGLFKAAVQDRAIAVSPCVGVTLPKTSGTTLTIPDVATVRRLGELLPERWSAVVYVAAGLGLRPGEVFGLRVSDLDFLRRVVQVEQQLDDRGRIGPLKTLASYRTIPLPDVVAVEVGQHLAGRGRDGLVFLNADGRPVRRSSFKQTWQRTTIEAGVPGLRLHDLRHVYASALINAGESPKTVQKRMGHASASVTLDVYSHVWPDSDERSRAAIDAFLGAAADSVRTLEA